MKTESFLFGDVPAHHGPVDLAELLTEIEALIHRFVVIDEQAAAALAVWVLHTYTFELRDTVAYVAIESPEKRCGKTTLISVLAAMSRKPLIASNITVSALFRAIDSCRPTLFIDEADTFLAGNGAMRGIINSGNTWRTAYVLRLSRSKKDKVVVEELQPVPVRELRETGRLGEASLPQLAEAGFKRFSCWCPKVIALIGAVPDTIADRSIVVKMSRKLTGETRAPLTDLDATLIKAKCARFALDAQQSITRHERISGEGLNDRAADTFDPLYVIARHAGPEWEKKLHTAAVHLTAVAQGDNSGTELIMDILAIFIETGRTKIFSRQLADYLREGGGGLRTLALKDSECNEYDIARMLRPYGIKPGTIRISQDVSRGYVDTDFREALKRYVPRTELEARMKEFEHRCRLQEEARAEAEKAVIPLRAVGKGEGEG